MIIVVFFPSLSTLHEWFSYFFFISSSVLKHSDNNNSSAAEANFIVHRSLCVTNEYTSNNIIFFAAAAARMKYAKRLYKLIAAPLWLPVHKLKLDGKKTYHSKCLQNANCP